MTESRTREQRLRRAAQRQNLRLIKNPRRDPRAVDYGGYNLVDKDDSRAFTDWADLDKIEQELYYPISKD
jgi:hypothetical protein